MKLFGIVRNAVEIITNRYADADLKQPNLTERGNIAVEQIIASPTGPVPSVADVDDNAIAPAQTVALGITENYVYNTVSNEWNRLLSVPNNADGQLALTTGTPGIITRLQAWNGATFDRLRTIPDNSDGQASLTLGTQGIIARLQGYNGATFDRIRSDGNNADAEAVKTLGGLETNAHAKLFNGVSWDRERGNEEFQILPSAARAVTTVSADILTYNAGALMALINVTVAAGGGQTLTFSIEGKDPVTGLYTTILTGAATALVGAYGLHINSAVVSAAWSGLVAAGSSFLSTFLPRTVRVRVTHSGAGAWTYSIAGFTRR